MVSKANKGKDYCWSCESYVCGCNDVALPEEKRACNVFVYLMHEGKMPKKFRDLKALGVTVLGRFKQPGLGDDFREEFLEGGNAKIIFIDQHKLLEEYFHEASNAYIPITADYSSEKAMKAAGLEWQKGDMVFLLLRRAPDFWSLRGGVYQPV